MRMAVKALSQESRDKARQEEARQQATMQQAVALYDKGQYDAAVEGLLLRLERNHDPLAAACIANLAWHGLTKEGADRELGSQMIEFAERSTDVNARRYLGIVLESIDWRRSLANYDWAAGQGNQDARKRASELKTRLKNQGLLPKGFFDKLLG